MGGWSKKCQYSTIKMRVRIFSLFFFFHEVIKYFQLVLVVIKKSHALYRNTSFSWLHFQYIVSCSLNVCSVTFVSTSLTYSRFQNNECELWCSIFSQYKSWVRDLLIRGWWMGGFGLWLMVCAIFLPVVKWWSEIVNFR